MCSVCFHYHGKPGAINKTVESKVVRKYLVSVYLNTTACSTLVSKVKGDFGTSYNRAMIEHLAVAHLPFCTVLTCEGGGL